MAAGHACRGMAEGQAGDTRSGTQRWRHQRVQATEIDIDAQTPFLREAITKIVEAADQAEINRLGLRRVQPAEQRPQLSLFGADLSADIVEALGHRVTRHHSAEAALRGIKPGRYDLVLTDLGMPGMSGWDFSRALRAVDPDVPLAWITGWGEEIDELHDRSALPANARKYLQFIEQTLGIPVEIVSVGPERTQTLVEV